MRNLANFQIKYLITRILSGKLVNLNLGLSTLIYLAPNTRFFISNAKLTKNWQKIKQMLSYTLRLNFCYLKIIHIPHTSHNPKTIRHILKNKQKNKSVCFQEIVRLINENGDENEKQITKV